LFIAAACLGQESASTTQMQSFRASDGSFLIQYPTPPWRRVEESAHLLRLQIDTTFFGFDPGAALAPSHLLSVEQIRIDDSLAETFGVANLYDVLNESRPLDQLGADETGTDSSATESREEPEEFAEMRAGDERVDSEANYLSAVDLSQVREVSRAEMAFLVGEYDALVDRGEEYFTTNAGLQGVTFQLVMYPGVFFRAAYLPTRKEVVRVAIISMFSLDDPDLDFMIAEMTTDAASEDGDVARP
jgi:hypothetical protein